MNANPVMSPEGRGSGVASPPVKLGGYLVRGVDVAAVPSENTTLLLPSTTHGREQPEEWEEGASSVNVEESKVTLTGSAARRGLMDADDKHFANVNVTTAGDVTTLYPGEGLQAGDGDLLKDGEGVGDGVPPLSSPSEVARGGVASRGSQVYWGSEDGLVHMGMRPRHRPRKQQRVKEEADPPTHGFDETTMHVNTQEMEELSYVTPESWTTDTPAAEDWTTEAAEEPLTGAVEERLTDSEEQNAGTIGDWPTVTRQESPSDAPEGRPRSTPEAEDVTAVTPEEHPTTSPEEWTSTTLQDEGDRTTFMPHEDQHPTGTQEVHSASILNPTPLSLSPMLSSSLPPLLTPTLPPSLPPTPSPQDAVEDTFRITTRGLDFLLEASPTGQSSPDTTELPKDDLFTLDLTITTTREGLKVDARDVTFDPSQIAKATSYEGSSYPTATRSATVTTTWVEEGQPAPHDRQGVAIQQRKDEAASPGRGDAPGELSTESRPDLQSAGSDTSTLPADDELMVELDALLGDGRAADGLPGQPDGAESDTESTAPTALPGDQKEHSTGVPRLTFWDEIRRETNTSGDPSGFPAPMTNATATRDGSNSTAKGSDGRAEETAAYEIPAATRNPGPQLSPSAVAALSACCAVVVVLAALSVALWVCRRHRNRSKIYLSREAAKPRAFFTRPMNPAVLPEDGDRQDAVYMFEFQRPRPPVLLGDDQKGIYFIRRDEGTEESGADPGIENEAFADVPPGEAGEGRTRLDPPEYDVGSKRDGDADSGIRVWSSTGSLHAAASPLPTHCRVPPPPYSPSLSKESVCLTVHSLPSLARNSQLFDV